MNKNYDDLLIAYFPRWFIYEVGTDLAGPSKADQAVSNAISQMHRKPDGRPPRYGPPV